VDPSSTTSSSAGSFVRSPLLVSTFVASPTRPTRARDDDDDETTGRASPGVIMPPYVPTGRKRGRPRDPNKKRPPKPGPPPEALRVRRRRARARDDATTTLATTATHD